MGSPVNRVNIMASYAVKSLGHDWSIWMDMSNKKKKKDHETLQHSSLPFSSFPSSAARLLFNSLSSQLNYLKFHTIMLISSLDFYWVRLRQRVRKWWMKKDGGVGHEEIMEARLKEALYQQYGIVVDERVFDG